MSIKEYARVLMEQNPMYKGITELQAPSKKKMPAGEYLKGHKLSAGSVFE